MPSAVVASAPFHPSPRTGDCDREQRSPRATSPLAPLEGKQSSAAAAASNQPPRPARGIGIKKGALKKSKLNIVSPAILDSSDISEFKDK
ncbi:hypothetical protein M5D96_011216, partial [Drosophila gunungcola]